LPGHTSVPRNKSKSRGHFLSQNNLGFTGVLVGCKK
jgi:hypothetical protein